MSDYYQKSVNGEILKPTKCRHNEACFCIVKKCDKCGWNPSVDKQRRAKMEASNG